MRRPARIALSIVLVGGSLGTLAASAAANTYSVKDPRDIRNSGALDITSTKVGHKGDRLLHAATLERAITPRGLEQMGGFIDFLVSTDGDLDTFERRIYVLGGSRFRVFVTNGTGRKLIGRGDAYHPSARTLGAVVSPNALGRPLEGYYWFAVAVTDGPGDGYVDVAPEKYWYIHDLTPPVVGDLTFGVAPAMTVPSVNVPISWSASDTGYGGLSSWTVRQRLDGSSAWTDVESGTFGLNPRVFDVAETTEFPSATQGATYEACVSMSDWAGQVVMNGPFPFSVPYDDANGTVFQYSGSGWTEQGAPTDFNGTLHATSVDGDSVTITVPAGLQQLLVVRGGFTGTAIQEVNGVAGGVIDLQVRQSGEYRGLYPLWAHDFHAPGGADDVIVLTKTGGDVLAIDGYFGVPAYVGGEPYSSCGGFPTLQAVASRARAAAIAPLSVEVSEQAAALAATRRV